MAWCFGEFTLEPKRFELARGGEPVSVEPQVLALLIHLIRHRDRMVGKDELARVVWQGRPVSDASLSSRVRSARQAVGDTGRQQSVIRTVHGRGFRFIAEVSERAAAQPTRSEPEAGPESAVLTRPSVAVLPFRPMGASPDLAILAEAIPHEIIQALSRLRWLAVIARGSSFRFRNDSPDLQLIGTALGADYVLSGTVETGGDRLIVVLELAHSGRSEVIWGDRLTAPASEIEDLRQRISAHVATALDLQIPQNEARLAGLAGVGQLDAWTSFHLGLSQIYRFTPAANEIAMGHFRHAVALDPRFARAHAGLSFTRFLDAFLQLGPDPREAATAARRHAERGLELDPLDPFTHFTMGRSFWLSGEPENAAGFLLRAVELNPNYAQGHYASALTAVLTGNVSGAESQVDTALNLSPLDPLLYAMHGVRALLLIQTGDTSAAARWADRAATTPGAHHLITMIAALVNGLDGRHQQAARWRQETRRRRPDACAAQFFAAFPIICGNTRAQLAQELRRQGF